MHITPAILETEFSEIQNKVNLLGSQVNRFQIDICDGNFVPTHTWPYSTHTFADQYNKELLQEITRLRELSCAFDLDLMIQDPEQTLVLWLLAKPARVIVHVASTEKMDRCFAILHGYQMEHPKFQYGIAIGVTDTVLLYKKYISRVDFVQCMGIAQIGVQGQVFDTRVFDQIAQVQSIDPEIPIHIDGGVDVLQLANLSLAGVVEVAVGSAIFAGGTPIENIQRLTTVM